MPFDYILELVKLSNLARIGGLKKKRARLFYDAGLDTLDKTVVWNAKEFTEMLSEFVKMTGFDGRAPSLSEAEHTTIFSYRTFSDPQVTFLLNIFPAYGLLFLLVNILAVPKKPKEMIIIMATNHNTFLAKPFLRIFLSIFTPL